MTTKQMIGGCGLALMLVTHFTIGYRIHTKTQEQVLECIASQGWSEQAIQFCTEGSLYE